MDWIVFKQHDKSLPLNAAHYVMLYPQDGDRSVAIDTVTSLHPVYSISYRIVAGGVVAAAMQRLARYD